MVLTLAPIMADSAKKKVKYAQDKGGSKTTSSIITDTRFSNIQTDPRYRLPSKRHTHVKLDRRFAPMLRDKEFSRNAPVDRYGRRLARDDTRKQLARFYRLDDDQSAGEREGNETSVHDDEEVLKELKSAERRDYDPARDGGFSSSSSSDEEDCEVEADADEAEFSSGQRVDVPLGEVTNRIAVVNLDWDNIRALDIMAVFLSFTPTGGRIHKVSIYPSEFGKERMEQEETEGPPKEIFSSSIKRRAQEYELEGDHDNVNESDESDDEETIKQSMIKEDQGEEFNMTQLRRYQLERLHYFYAIIEFSSEEAAKEVYDAIDGTEYLSSANFFDLRFVPNDTDFSDDKPREECERLSDGYQPTEFVTDALQHSKVKLTWDADDNARKEAQAKAFRGGRKEIDENDLKAYLGTDSSDDGEAVKIDDGHTGTDASSTPSTKEAEKQRMRALFGLTNEPTAKPKPSQAVGDMEITFASGLAGEPTRESVFENDSEPDETTKEKYIRKERERRRRRKEKIKASRRGETVSAAGEVSPPAENGAEKDLGFNDTFFDDPDEMGRPITQHKNKEEKRRKREERAAVEATSAAQRAELELLMVDDHGAGIKHFDMKEIEKTEKRARNKGKKGRRMEDGTAVDDFQIDVGDPRFRRLYESHEFAIDPTHPKFKGTSTMRAILDENRKRRRLQEEGDDNVVDVVALKKRKKQQPQRAASTNDVTGKDDWKQLVAKVKKHAAPQG